MFTKEEYLKSFDIKEEIYNLATKLIEVKEITDNKRLSIQDIDHDQSGINIRIYERSCNCCSDEYWDTIRIPLEILLEPDPIKIMIELIQKKKAEETKRKTEEAAAEKLRNEAATLEHDRKMFERLKAKFGNNP